MDVQDPSLWELAAKWLWGLLLIPFGLLWKKADSAVQKPEIDAMWKAIDRRRETHDDLLKQLREHERRDDDRFERTEKANRDRHDELVTLIGDMRSDIAGLKR